MKLTVSKSQLSAGFQKVNSIVGSRSTMQITSNVLLETADEKLVLTTTDLEIRIRAEIPANIIEAGSATLPAKKIYDIVKELDEELVELESVNNHITVKCGNANFKLLGLNVDDFPISSDIHPVRQFNIEQVELARMINLIAYSVGPDDGRKAITGIYLNIEDGNITSVATDGRRLALVEKTVEDIAGENGGIIIPLKTALELNKLLSKEGMADVIIGENSIKFDFNNGIIMSSKLIEENYPNYKQVIPLSFSVNIEVSRNLLTSILRRISYVVSEKNFFVKLHFANNRLEVSALSSDIGEGNDYMDIEYSGPELTVSFNPIYLLEPLNRLDSDVIEIKMNEGYSPMSLATSDGFFCVMMPILKR